MLANEGCCTLYLLLDCGRINPDVQAHKDLCGCMKMVFEVNGGAKISLFCAGARAGRVGARCCSAAAVLYLRLGAVVLCFVAAQRGMSLHIMVHRMHISTLHSTKHCIAQSKIVYFLRSLNVASC